MPIEEVYSAFFYTASTHTLHQQSDKILFGCFVTTLNAAFEWKLALEDEGYESSSENFNMPTPLRKNTEDPTRCLASRMLHLIQIQLHHAVSPQASMQMANI